MYASAWVRLKFIFVDIRLWPELGHDTKATHVDYRLRYYETSEFRTRHWLLVQNERDTRSVRLWETGRVAHWKQVGMAPNAPTI